MKLNFKLKLSIWLLPLLAGFVLLNSAKASEFTPPEAKYFSYQARYYSQSIEDPITMEAGSTKEVVVKFKNSGQKIWPTDGWNYVSVYTVNPNYGASDLADPSWLSDYHPILISKQTAPGEIGEFKIKLKAPDKIGEYKQDFNLAVEDSTWIKGGYFFLKVKVIPAKPKYNFTKELNVGDDGEEVKQLQLKLKELGYYTHSEITGYYGDLTKQAVVEFQKANKLEPYPGFVGPGTRAILNNMSDVGKVEKKEAQSAVVPISTSQKDKEVVQLNNDYQADIIGITSNRIEVKGGQRVNFKVIYNNSGEKTWNQYVLREAGSQASTSISIASVKEISLADETWLTDKKVVSGSGVIAPEDVLRVAFNFRAPAKKGVYIARFDLNIDGHILNGGSLEIPVIVTEDAPTNYQAPVLSADLSNRDLIKEPDIKVGLYSSEDPVKVKSPVTYLIYSGDEYRGLLVPNTEAILSYSNGIYKYKSVGLEFTSNKHLRLMPGTADGYFILPEYVRTVSWRGDKSFNAYRGILEYIYSPRKNIPYIVNELPLDAYVAGIAETSNEAHAEYAKAILVAARSYAYYSINNGTPKDQRTFDVYGSTVDQLYLGYISETLMPRIVRSAKDTYGEMVTYNREPVITPYFGHSDGITRTWKQVWGGSDKLWIKQVNCEYDQGLSMYGHGVGMSARDASYRAGKDGWDYKKILKYYYSGVEVEKIY
ncbi:MAG: peptidoglycan-binding protein [bacterium]